MTDTAVQPEVVRTAWAHARRAAEHCRVDIRVIGADAVAAAQAVVRDAWGPRQVPQQNLLRALSHAGNAVVAAVRGTRPVGVAFGFLGWAGGLHLHSHMTAVVRGEQSRGVGVALKSWQRALCLDNGVTEMRWTYDPLIARNAHFNLVKLGARVREFLPDFYGAMDDTVNTGDHSDRFEVSWELDSERVRAALERRGTGFTGIGEAVHIPEDFDALRRSDAAAGRAVRLAARARFTSLFADGLRPEWSGGGYVFVPAGSGAGRRDSTVGATHG
ncbi:GNAT family N-acetyltransferase [Pseudonocardia acidicola]|uniref:GNAT family N-acetyltransferase n=1 Tax=Pseudonocardia acidicola TaxID=2724939 RepID=A0ABX1SE04_9PSEU|nr:GNAT family N-acetyltransferase [Pseudonocardia acidicola]NMH98428.1 GNAT family N-acetyltransferase [Pseudonocardia acidicola]